MELDPNFMQEMRMAMDNMDRMPAMRRNILERMDNLSNNYNNLKGVEGVISGKLARQRLVHQKKY